MPRKARNTVPCKMCTFLRNAASSVIGLLCIVIIICFVMIIQSIEPMYARISFMDQECCWDPEVPLNLSTGAPIT